MKILYLCFNQEGKGTYLRAFRLASDLVKLGQSLTLICASNNNSFEEKTIDGVQVVAFPYGRKYLSGWNVVEVGHRNKWLESRRYDVVHAFETRPTCIIPALKIQKRGAILLTDWADWFGKSGSVEERDSGFLKMLLRLPETFFESHYRAKAVGTTVISGLLRERAGALGINAATILQLPNGLDQEVGLLLSTQEARSSLELTLEPFTVGVLGAFFQKDFDLLADTIDALPNRGKGIRFLQIGKQPTCTLHPLIISTGVLPGLELNLYLQACDLFLLPLVDIPANNARFPLKFSDYLSAGRPVIATNVGDQAALIQEYKAGLVTQPNPLDLASAISQLRQDEVLRQQLGENAWALSRKSGLRWQDHAAQLLAFYQERLQSIS